MTEDHLGRWQLGDIARTQGGHLFQVIGFIASPAITVRAVDNEGLHLTYVIGSLLEQQLVRLVPEEKSGHE